MKISGSIAKILIGLFLPLGLIAQDASKENGLVFDQAYFKESNYEMLELFASEVASSPDYISFIVVSKDYSLNGVGEKLKNESLIVSELIRKKGATSAELKADLMLNPGEVLLNYFAENLNPKAIISFRIISAEMVQVKYYELHYD